MVKLNGSLGMFGSYILRFYVEKRIEVGERAFFKKELPLFYECKKSFKGGH